jgi:hypothetical protein
MPRASIFSNTHCGRQRLVFRRGVQVTDDRRHLEATREAREVGRGRGLLETASMLSTAQMSSVSAIRASAVPRPLREVAEAAPVAGERTARVTAWKFHRLNYERFDVPERFLSSDL